METVRMLSAGEQGLVVEFGNAIDPVVNSRVHQVSARITAARLPGVLEVVPTYRSLLIYFDPLTVTRRELADALAGMLPAADGADGCAGDARVVEIPVCYGGDFGPDIEFVAQHNNLTTDDVVTIHTSVPYLVYMLGFTPGFPYLGGMSDRIAAPRLEKPRTAIPAGSVGIAGSQTGFYPVESPGGWRLIGRTPVKAFDAASVSPFLFAAGDYLRFKAITAQEYAAIAGAVAEGSYTPVITALDKKEGGV